MEGEKGLLKKGSSSKYCYSKIFDSLNKGLVDNKLYKVKKAKNDLFNIFFEPKARKQLGVTKMSLKFDGKKRKFQNISILKLFYQGEKNPVLLKRKTLKVKKKFPKGTFSFKTPSNTEVQSMK